MNERITELYVQANKYAQEEGFKKYDKAGDVNWKWEDTVFEKFAELVVRECIEVVKPTGHHEVWAQSYLGGVDGLDLLYSKVKDIKKHFGVEE